MKTILCFGDSNTHGLNPDWIHTGVITRHPYNVRWPGKLAELLGPDFRVIEEGLNGRTTVFDDSVSVGRNGLPYFLPCLESHSPLDLVIIMLGTNDTKPIIAATPFDITAGMARLAKAALDPYTYTTEKPPKVLIAAPAPLGEASVHSPEEAAAREKSKALAPLYRDLAKNLGCGFIDAGAVASAAEGEGVHLDARAHAALAEAMRVKVLEMLA